MATWRKGEKAALARAAGVSPGQITYYLKRKKRASAETAIKLGLACKKMCLPIKREDWVFTRETENPYFEGKPLTGV